MNHLTPRSDEVLAVAYERYLERVLDRPLSLEGFVTAVGEGWLCECGCGAKPDANSKYAIRDRCRQQAYHNRVTAVARDQGVETRPNLTQLTAGTGTRSADVSAPARKPRKRNTDLRLSYRKVVDEATVLVLSLTDPEQMSTTAARALAESHMSSLLTDKQRAVLDQMSNREGNSTHV